MSLKVGLGFEDVFQSMTHAHPLRKSQRVQLINEMSTNAFLNLFFLHFNEGFNSLQFVQFPSDSTTKLEKELLKEALIMTHILISHLTKELVRFCHQ